jgi:hypothetical protein
MRKTGDYRLSGNLLFCLLVAPAPKPLFAEFHSAAAHRSGAFLSLPSAGFLKNGEIGTSAKSQFLDKIFPKALTEASVCVTIVRN